MKPVKPRYTDTVKVEWRIPKKSKQIISLYADYTKYSEEELISKAIGEILEDKSFIEWLKNKRYQKRIKGILSEAKLESFSDLNAATEEDNEF